ncbi:FAD-binding protein [Legionella lytica]|uniref:FAD-binding protein n=1 Tax=Legionella lytica TaxID=96232 RepID=A0ABY4Y9Y4_9GAMM|nr:FAD-binding protein [Legionella lytica]USQ14442.1 FAD-binding protein [Legionella lytica]
MPQTVNQWNSQHLMQWEKKPEQNILSNEQALVPFGRDFGGLVHSQPAAVCEPQTREALQSLLKYAHEHQLPVTIRGNGMSQNGQSLAAPGGLILNMKHFNQAQEPEHHSIWMEANCTWADLLKHSLPHSLTPYVLPYNCNLSIGGVLSAGGIGASSFKYGSVIAHVRELEVILANGELVHVDRHSPLMQACLGGQGHFGVITKARIALRTCKKSVRTFYLTYLDKESWLHDLHQCQNYADYVESFCTPAIQGAKLIASERTPFAQWLYALHVSIEYDHHAPEFHELSLKPWKVLHTQDETIHSYLHRHDARLNIMKMSGQWELEHPWYECFIPKFPLNKLEEILDTLPVHYASLVHLIPIVNRKATGFLMLPEEPHIFSFMIINPGLPKVFTPSCVEAIKHLDTLFLPLGGKRYLSGYLGESLKPDYWKNHYGARYSEWLELKKQYDPLHILSSYLFNKCSKIKEINLS